MNVSMIQRETTIQLTTTTTIHTGHPTVAAMEVTMASAPETAMIYLPKELSLGMMTQTTFLVQCVVDGNCNTSKDIKYMTCGVHICGDCRYSHRDGCKGCTVEDDFSYSRGW